MIVISVKLNVEKFIDEKWVNEWETHKINVSISPHTITMRMWSDYWVKRSEMPDWFKTMEGMNENELSDYSKAFDESKVSEYMNCIATLVSCFCNKPNILRELPFSENDNSIIALFSKIIHSLYSYEPKYIESFEFKGQRFVFPKTITDQLGRDWVGQELSTGEAIEALQASHILNSKDEHGQYVLNDRKYHTDIALLASLARKVNEDGTIEKVPIETGEARVFFEKRTKFFEDAPMDIALDMGFFLSSGKLASVNTPTYQLLTSLLQQV